MLRVYLKGSLADLDGFVPDKKSPNTGTCEGFRLVFQDGRWHCEFYDCDVSLPSFLTEIVDEVSFHTNLSKEIRREFGIYKHKSATAEIEPELACAKWWVKLRIRAKNMEDLRELRQLIKTGAIRPEESYEGSQQGLSRQQLEAQVAELKAKSARISELELEIKTLKGCLRQANVEWDEFHQSLEDFYREVGSRIFFFSRRALLGRIHRILHPA